MEEEGVDVATLFRVSDRRYPFLWADSSQPPGRWHGSGEGPCHYLATTAKGAWAEILRHEAIDDVDDLADLERTLWQVRAHGPWTRPALDPAVLVGDLASHPTCQAEARRLRAAGHRGLCAPSAALLSQEAELYGVDATGESLLGAVPSETIVIFGAPTNIAGMPQGEGHPDPLVLADVRHL